MTTKVTTFSLRLPVSLKAAVERLAAADGTSMNQFLVMAAAEKLRGDPDGRGILRRTDRGKADKDAAIRFLTRRVGEVPRRRGRRWWSSNGQPRIEAGRLAATAAHLHAAAVADLVGQIDRDTLTNCRTRRTAWRGCRRCSPPSPAADAPSGRCRDRRSWCGCRARSGRPPGPPGSSGPECAASRRRSCRAPGSGPRCRRPVPRTACGCAGSSSLEVRAIRALTLRSEFAPSATSARSPTCTNGTSRCST